MHKHVDHVWSFHGKMRATAALAVIDFPARGLPDLVAKLAFVQRTQVFLLHYQKAFPALVADATRLGGPSDERLIKLGRETETAQAVQKLLWERRRDGDDASAVAANEASKRAGQLARDLFRLKAHSLQGVLAKLRVVRLAYGRGAGASGDINFEAYQRDADWLGSTIADLERLAGATWETGPAP